MASSQAMTAVSLTEATEDTRRVLTLHGRGPWLVTGDVA